MVHWSNLRQTLTEQFQLYDFRPSSAHRTKADLIRLHLTFGARAPVLPNGPLLRALASLPSVTLAEIDVVGRTLALDYDPRAVSLTRIESTLARLSLWNRIRVRARSLKRAAIF